ncbi:MAG: rod shape-determining protein MreC [Proteobacteria bacterium]|nr:rod shape-determining protein MreC [Pseudomonadota bacterium]MCL2307538.1 rod shape-determining protein MreC [Pseudomonadota bacterium]
MIPGDPPPYLYRGPSILARFVFFALLSLSLLLVDTRYQHLEKLRAGIALALYPLQQLARWPRTMMQEVGVYFTSKEMLEKQNTALSWLLLDQGHMVQEAQTVQQENARLRELLQLKAQTPRNTHAVEMLYDTRDPFVQKITIDKGQTHGIMESSAVLDPYGVIGQVTHVSPFTSDVTLLVEKNHTTPVQVERTGMRSVLYGMGAGVPMELRFVSPAADVLVGDRLVTSGLGSVYPPGLAVAIITAIDNDAEQSFVHITARPTAGVASSRYLLVVDALPLTPTLSSPPSPPEKNKSRSRPPVNRKVP